jgi:hypothetical protein
MKPRTLSITVQEFDSATEAAMHADPDMQRRVEHLLEAIEGRHLRSAVAGSVPQVRDAFLSHTDLQAITPARPERYAYEGWDPAKGCQACGAGRPPSSGCVADRCYVLTTVMDRPRGGSTVEGISPSHGAKMLLDFEVRRNEVLLRVRAGSGEGVDVAVGLDDFQDAFEGVIARA